MSELDLFDTNVDPESLSKHTEGLVRDIVVAHVENLEVSLLKHALFERLNLRVRKFVANKVQLADWDNNKEVREDLTRDFVVVNIKFGDFPALDGLDQSHRTVVVDVVVLKENFFDCVAPVNQVANHEATLGAHVVLREVETAQILLLLVFQGRGHDFYSFIANRVASQI